MAGYDDLVKFASRAGRVANNPCTVTEGRTLDHDYRLFDAAGTPISLSTGFTFECKILPAIDGTAIATMTVAGTTTGFTVKATASTMATVASTLATLNNPRRAIWYCWINRTSDSAKVQVWGLSGSPFLIESE